ncbi:N-acetylglucosamine-6-phosphate deacetylase [Nitratireductor sp. ZSWI3]|uniref:N-acetylglucosamine-6-phosphate deacetylase n=1 Tax=Nitratireductor sp. ZSWI3 TaxID=2966359 RepID=UPI00214FA472|nr:amidohydrolase family protein [Nitratireductor sp. ZSWI3]MCR4264552.1 amidohydrolase family protein [Nitratireductor sp. ZSWI3]
MTDETVIAGIDPASGRGLAVAVHDGRIVAIEEAACDDGAFLSPGLVDLQVNGYAGIDLNDGRLLADSVSKLSRMLASLGVAAYLPTLITASQEALLDALSAIAAARAADPLCARMIPGVHMEGPAIAHEDGPRGAHPDRHVRPPSLEEFAGWQKASGNLVRLVTLAPEHAGAPDFIRAVTAQGVHVALGHSAATAAEIHAAAAAGADLSTHLGNGVSAQLPRHPNLIWAQLADDRLTATFIADGHHLPADTFKSMLRAKGLDRSVLVSDSVALAGMPAGLYSQAIGGQVEVRADGRIGIAGTSYLAGAGLPLIADIPIAMRMAGLSLPQALRLATANPGAFIGRTCLLAVGEPADLIRFSVPGDSGPLSLEAAWIAGEEVFRA